MSQTMPQFPIRPNLSQRARQLLEAVCATMRMPQKVASLNPDEDRVRRFILNTYPVLGRAPRRREIESAFPQYTNKQIDQICRTLSELDIVYIPKGSDEIAGAYPFIDVRNDHAVRFHWQGKACSAHAMCAIDALGIPFMYATDAEIQSSCAHCQKRIDLIVRGEAITLADPATTVVFVGLRCAAQAATSLCTTLLFFCSRAHAKAWRAAHGQPAGETLTLGESLALGKEFFANLLQPSHFLEEPR